MARVISVVAVALFPAIAQAQDVGAIGVTVRIENNSIKILKVIEDGPADKAGVQAGDVITMVDHVSAQEFTATQIADKIRGPIGTSIVITIARPGRDKPIELTLIRARIAQQAAPASQPTTQAAPTVTPSDSDKMSAQEQMELHMYPEKVAAIDAATDAKLNAMAIDPTFLDSEIMITPGISGYGPGFTVRAYIKRFLHTPMDSSPGSHGGAGFPKLVDVNKNENAYRVKLSFAREACHSCTETLYFTHITASPFNGKISQLYKISVYVEGTGDRDFTDPTQINQLVGTSIVHSF
jgi:hypothetical protein